MKKIKLIFLLSVAILLINCSYYTKSPIFVPIEKTYNIKDTPDIKVSTDLVKQASKADVLVISDIKNSEKEHYNESQRYLSMIKDTVYKRLLASHPNFIVKKELNEKDHQVYKDLDKKIYRLDIAVTYYKPGNGFLRYIIGFDYCGGVFVQIEGKITDISNEKDKLSFVICEKNNGDPDSGLNVMVFSDKYCSNKAIKNIVEKLVSNIVDYI